MCLVFKVTRKVVESLRTLQIPRKREELAVKQFYRISHQRHIEINQLGSASLDASGCAQEEV